jgi:hypothetical protein
MVSRFRAFAALVALVVAWLAVGAALPVAARETPLPDSFRDIAVDDAHRQVFVSSPWSDTVTVLDFDGNVRRTLTDLPRAGSLLVEGSTLFVAVSGAGRIDAYDTATLDRVGRYGVGTLVEPGPLAMAAGKLWTSTGPCMKWNTQLASVDLTTKAVEVYDAPPAFRYCIGLADGAHDTDQLVAFTDGTSPPSTVRLDVVNGVPRPAVERRQENLGIIRQLALTPDGQSFVAAPTDQYRVGTFRTADQTQDGPVYATGLSPNSVAVTGARGGLLAVGLDAPYDTDVEVFVLGDPSQRIFHHDFGGPPSNTLFARGLAFSGDGYRLFAVTVDGDSGATRFHVLHLTPVTVSLSVDLTVSVPGTPVTFTAGVTVDGGLDPAGTVAFADASGMLGTAPLVGGTAALTVVDLPVGAHDVTATYSGDSGSSRSAPVRHTVESARPSPPGLPGQTGPIAITAGAGGGYWMISDAGDVYAFGGARHFGNQAGIVAVDLEPTPTNGGYWILSRSGRVFAKGDAARFGDAPLAGDERAVSLSATPSGRGYWVFTDKGRAFNFGDAPYRGDMAGVTLNGPVLGSVATPSGQGYWMVASDGGIFSFGDAAFAGSMGGRRMNQPVMSMAPDPDGSGYWLISADGGTFAFSAPFYGSTGGIRLNRPISGMVPGQDGYLMVAEDGGIFAFGAVAFHGSLGATPPSHPIVAVALTKAR